MFLRSWHVRAEVKVTVNVEKVILVIASLVAAFLGL